MSASASWDALCRLCLSSRARLQPIFGTDPPDLALKIQACVSVQVKEDDTLPTKVCTKCLDNVNNWLLFKGVCEKSQTKLKGLTGQTEVLQKIKSEPLTDEAYDDGVIIDGSYVEYDQGEAASKLQPEGPPILASLGLAPRSDKMADSEREEEEEEEVPPARATLPTPPEVSVTVMRPTGELLQARQNIQQLASKNCLVCGRAYRYSHNARRHELSSHRFDRYTNKIVKNKRSQHHQKLRPNPFNPKARLMPNPINPKIQLIPHVKPPERSSNRTRSTPMQPKNVPITTLPYPLKVKTLTDLQPKKKEPQILKSLLTARAKAMVHDREVIHSGPESPETLISEPEIASFQVETILSEPDAFVNSEAIENEEETEPEDHSAPHYDRVAMDSEQEMEIAQQESNDSHRMSKNGDAQEHEANGDQVSQHDERYDEYQDEGSNGKESLSNTEAIIENGIGDHEEENGDVAEEGMQEYDEEVMPIAPIVEINEVPQNDDTEGSAKDGQDNEETGDVNDLEDPSLLEDRSLLEPQVPAESKQYLTKVQRDFLIKNRDLIEQINTKSCKCCQVTYSRRKEVIQHLQKQGYKVPKHTCYNCVITFGTIGALLSHMRANACTNMWQLIYEDDIPEDMVQDKPEVKVQYKDILNARSYACKLCPAKFQLKQVIMKHVLDVHEDGQSRVPLACVHCGYRFKENRLWKKHIRNGECTVNIACDLCPDKFQTILEFNDHAVAAHAGSFDGNEKTNQVDSRPTDCSLCQKPHSNYHNLVKHLRAFHNEERPHFCTHCDAKFEHIADLNQHIYASHSERHEQPDLSIVKEEAEEYHYSCTECNNIFETVDAWTDHQIAEHNQVAHRCDQCDKKFLRPSELVEHKKSHLRMKVYPCVVCQSSFQTPQRLADHVEQAHPGVSQSVTPDNQFYCEICVRGFKNRQAYSNHMRIHSKVPTTNRRPGDPKPRTPVQSYAPFTPPSRNNPNIPNAPYSCDICGKGFMHKKNIWKHKKVLHADIVGTSADKHDSEDNTMQASTEGEDDSQQDSGRLSIPQFNSFNFSSYTPPAKAPAAKASAAKAAQQQAQAVLFSCEMCGKKFPLKTSLWKHKRAKHGVINPSNKQQPIQDGGDTAGGGRSSCTICKITFADKKSYYRHRKNVHRSNVQMCKICGKPLNSTLELYEHLKAAHARELLGYNAASAPRHDTSDANTADDGGAGDYQARYPCDMCGKQFVGMLALQNHQCVSETSQQNSTFDCEICNKSYTSISALKSHRGWHLRSPDGKAAANNTGLWMPQNKVTNKHSKHEVMEPTSPAPRSAQIAASTKRRLPDVELTVVPQKKFRPDDAMSEEEVLSHLAQRSQPQAEPDDRYCAICDKEFTKKAAYQRHMDEVHRPNSVFCPVCEKSFTRKSTLLVHMRKHYEGGGGGAEGVAGTSMEDGEVYACDLCGAQYRSTKALRAHKARHHGEEEEESEEEEEEEEEEAPVVSGPGEFTCGQCGEGVATPRDLISHRAIHATPSKFFCQICKVYFPRAVDLSQHTRTRHADNEKVFFPCAMCDRFYMNKKSLQRHIETSH